MKNLMNKISLVVLIGMMFSCSNHPQPRVVEPEPIVIIVKFTDPFYKEHVIVNDYENTSALLLMRGNLCDRKFEEDFPEGRRTDNFDYDRQDRLRNPFWELPDGWFLIDWSWFGINGAAYPYTGNCVLTDVTWDNFYDYKSYVFDRSIPHITKKRKELYTKKSIYIADLMGYSHPDGNYPTFQIRYVDESSDYDSTYTYTNEYTYFRALTDMPWNTSECLCCTEWVEDLDKLWTLLHSQLSALIENGDLENIKSFDVNQLFVEVEL